MNEGKYHRFYVSTAWKRTRENKLCHDPLCEIHLIKNQLVPATDVHHLIPISKDYSLRFEFTNLQSLCHYCHSVITSEEKRAKPKGAILNMKWKS